MIAYTFGVIAGLLLLGVICGTICVVKQIIELIKLSKDDSDIDWPAR